MYRISNIYVLAAFGTIGGALFGFDISSMSAWIGTDQYLEYFNSPDSNLQGGITASMSAGSFVGAIGAGFVSDRLGRRKALMIACAIWVVGIVVQCSSQNVAQLIAGRVIAGLAGLSASMLIQGWLTDSLTQWESLPLKSVYSSPNWLQDGFEVALSASSNGQSNGAFSSCT